MKPRKESTLEPPVDLRVPYDEAEREYLELHLAEHDGNVSKVAKATAVGRVHRHPLQRRAGLR